MYDIQGQVCLSVAFFHRISRNAVVGWGDSFGAEFPFLCERSERMECFYDPGISPAFVVVLCSQQWLGMVLSVIKCYNS